jgi:hypothetical protein
VDAIRFASRRSSGEPMDYRADLISRDPQDGYYEKPKAFMAPVARESDAVSKDPAALEVAEAIYGAYGDSGKGGDRLLEQATARRDFSMLLPEQYRSAAQKCEKDELAVPLGASF